jgi:hypothetical protein
MPSLETRRGRMLARGDREPSARKLSVIPPWEKKAKKEKNASRQKKKGTCLKAGRPDRQQDRARRGFCVL